MMQHQISFTVPGRPVPAARMTQRGKWVSKAAVKYLAYKEHVGWCARAAVKEIITGYVAVEIWAFWDGKRPGDSDNIAKAVLDGCNRIIWEDDSQVIDLFVHKRQGRPQRTEVKIWEVGELEGAG